MTRWMKMVVAAVALSGTCCAAVAQQEIPICTVTTGQELLNALRCIANGQTTDCADPNSTCATCPNGTPDRIVVPVSAEITVPFMDNSTTPPTQINSIRIGIEHSCPNRPLKITIRGKVKWVGGVSSTDVGYRILTIDGARSLTIDGDGTGRIYSTDDPATNQFLARAFRILDGDNITIQNLNVDHLGYVADMGESHTRNQIKFINVAAEEMSGYGIEGGANNVLIENCRVGDPNNLSIKGTYTRRHVHPARIPDLREQPDRSKLHRT